MTVTDAAMYSPGVLRFKSMAASVPRVVQAVYLVYTRVQPGNPGDPNRQLLAAKLTHAAAMSVVANVPGAYIEKVVADKQHLPAPPDREEQGMKKQHGT